MLQATPSLDLPELLMNFVKTKEAVFLGVATTTHTMSRAKKSRTWKPNRTFCKGASIGMPNV
jgi:hypothetical protein